MGGVNVKNTIVERVLQIVAPHPCSGCAKVGSALCLDCKYDIINDRFFGCILCGTPQSSGICSSHNSPIERAFTVSARAGTVETLINRLKFQNTKAVAFSLAELLNDTLPLLPDDTELIPLPTVQSHSRQRGYDQVDLITRHLAAMRNLCITRPLIRKTTTTQKTANRKRRISQSMQAFDINSTPVKGKRILLIDDVVTTGATLQAAARLLKDAGATVWVATLAYQPLD